MNVEYQELINVTLWQKGSKWHSLPKFVCVCLCNFLIINSGLYALSLNSYVSVAHKQHALHPFAQAVINVHAFHAVAHARVFAANLFCLFFSKKINIMSALFLNQPLTPSQKIDSREGLFWCKIGVACACGKMNFYLKSQPFAPVSGLFAAKFSAFCRKTECVMVLNAVRFGAKRKVKWCKMQCDLPLNARRKA